ncbi:Uncharacterised protein [Clostridioides difficile]|nr:Uncharacterised protein [Clostridioides difficile]
MLCKIPKTVSAIPENNLIIEPNGSLNTFARNSAKVANVFQIKATISISMLPVATKIFPIKLAATDIAPATTPTADILVFAKWLKTATPTNKATTKAIIPATTQKIGHANIASFTPHCPSAYNTKDLYPSTV